MGQNRSTAVRQRRHEPLDSLDDFPTPPWATRALVEFLIGLGYPLEQQSAWEPACNRLHMVRPMRETFASVRASDVFSYGDHERLDFVTTGRTEPAVDWIFCNPPFRLAEDFIAVALERARVGVAMLVRAGFAEGGGRYSRLFAPSRCPPSYELVFCERVVMLKGRLIRVGEPDPFSKPVPNKRASSATGYVWMVWLRDRADAADTRKRWIRPCRLRLERPGDYPVYGRLAAGAGDYPLLAEVA